MDILDRFSIERAVVQAGMADISRSELAAAVSQAGGLGTIGLSQPPVFEDDIKDTIQRLNGETFSVNLLMPFVLKEHVAACIRHRVPIATLFFGLNPSLIKELKDNGTQVIMQVGSLEEAKMAVSYGVDGIMVQGTEAGGHVRGNESLAELLPRVKEALPDVPLLAAGGIHNRETANSALQMGADGIVSGTRFLMSHESLAHDEYKKRLVEADDTVLTHLFGMGWPDKHRVLVNRATQRWTQNGATPSWIRLVHKASSFMAKSRIDRQIIVSQQRVALPFFSPLPLHKGMNDELADVTALYAGQCVSRIDDIVSASAIVESFGI